MGALFLSSSGFFINREVLHESQLQEILIHEQCHVEQKHSIDVMLSELFTILCWFNPFAWLLKREIRLNLEYLADFSCCASRV